MSTPRKILGDVINKQDEKVRTKYQALENPLSDAEGKAAGTPSLDFSSTVRKERAYSKNEARGEFEQNDFTESKALEKSADAKMVRFGGFFVWKPS